jgi:hypothetical protein
VVDVRWWWVCGAGGVGCSAAVAAAGGCGHSCAALPGAAACPGGRAPDGAQAQGAALDEVDDAAGRAHHHVHATLQVAHLVGAGGEGVGAGG